MANGLYDKGREGFLDGSIDWDTNTMKAMLVRTVAGPGAGGSAVYAVNLATHVSLSDVPNNAYARVATVTLGGKTVTGGVADAADATWPAVAAGDPIGAILIFQDPGTGDANTRLIAYIDTETGLPVTPNGGDLIEQWDNGANRIFKL